MTTGLTTERPAAEVADSPSPPTRGRARRYNGAETRGAWALLAPYLVLLLVAGLVPIGYALVTSLQKAPTPLEPDTGFGGLDSFRTVVSDYRFLDTFLNIFAVLIVWLPIMMIGIVGLALLIHASPGRFGASMRFLYFIPGALAGVANFVLWVYLLNPSQSPVEGFWHALGIETIKQAVASPGHLPFILTAMMFFQGVGSWIVVVNGGLNGISEETLEAASLDGANAWQLAWHVKLPIIRPWIGYAALMNLAYGFQLFLEPQLLDQVSSNAIDDQWTPTQLGYAFAFSNYNFPAAAAMSLILVVITMAIGLVIVFRSGLFGEKEHA
ncbi:carbohydrate ABC transporter permease [Nocardioides bruguierae]|uniref:carbohydrate ABC transporter permease n=1 Tax=Nocardioides bruguierae TaxID=2945102 RepID=UPI0020201366|nr:sugar ABC transporter permease [Nocardioides bruguierae]MCL8025486.1 sugar ABC transporter permease [Nocardioides bruguierae]